MTGRSFVAKTLAEVVAGIPAHVPARYRVLCAIDGAYRRLHYCPFLTEIAAALGRDPSTLSKHVDSLVGEGLIIHQTGSHRCAITPTGQSRAGGLCQCRSDAHR